jgi:AcrR family transcriptional regulator
MLARHRVREGDLSSRRSATPTRTSTSRVKAKHTRGRPRRGQGSGRADILSAATSVFARSGVGRTSVRAIAREAGVDPALVWHYFGTKERLFVEAVLEHIGPSVERKFGRVPASREVGTSVVESFFRGWESKGGDRTFVGLLRSAVTEEWIAERLRRLIEREIAGSVPKGSSANEARFRTGLVASQLLGLGLTRYVIRLPAIANASTEKLARSVGPTVQRYLRGPLTDRKAGKRG